MSHHLREQFEEQGFVILRQFLKPALFQEIKDEINQVGRFIVDPRFDFDVYQPDLMTPKKQSQLYDRLHYLPCLSRLSGNPDLLQACRDLGIVQPVLMGCCNMRYDRPDDARHLFDWHQDTIYLLGSVNAVTIWIPFGPVDEHHGTIQVIPGSHHAGIHPFKKISDKTVEPHRQFLQRDLSFDGEITEPPVTVQAVPGDVIIFRQMLLHRSLPNLSDKVRWTAQVRVSDLCDPGYLEAGCPNGDKHNIFFQAYPGFVHPESVKHEN
ncbi:phytanoyl-CoA dioxygenase family protein [Undibacterium luofuense]|uniref:phytanoyl-CoA dioxygenase family protein n=1 Tax=Undibacterium luofuense TaxID=2828733 RepID=UPI0030EE4D9D